MRKCLFILLITTILLNSCGYLFLYLELKKQNKKEMLNRISSYIPDDQLTKIKILKSSMPHWESTDEFEYNGSMYDVVRMEDKGDYILYSCLNDKKEETIIKNFKRHFDERKNQSRNSSHNNHFQLVVFTAILNKVFSLQRRNNLLTQIRTRTLIYNSVTKDILSPPPKSSFI